MNKVNAGDHKGKGTIIYPPTEQEKLDNKSWNLRIISHNLKRLRKEKGLSQTDVALTAGVQPYQVCNLEGNKYYSVTLLTVGLVARALGISVSDLLIDPL